MSKKYQPSTTQRVKAERVPNEQLKAHRLKKNWTQVYVASMIGANDVEVSRWETGTAEPSLYFREKLCELFGVSPEALGFVPSSETKQGETAQHLLQRRDPLTSLLATRLYVPRPRTSLVPRPHLIERLQQGGACALTLISAPAGFGKTTLLAQWLAETRKPIAWLSLEPEDNDATRFLSYLVAALQTLDPGIGTTALAMLHSPHPTPVEAVLTVLANELVNHQGVDIALVLDDYHVITTPSIHQGMRYLVEHLPPQMHLILATRTDPPFPLARLRAQGRLCEVRTAELRFADAEARTFLETVMGLHLLPEAIATLQSRTEGWIVGLQLAGLFLQGRADVALFLAAFSGTHRFVLDYLSEEVLLRQPASVQSFLLHTSILDRLNEPLCDAVTGKPGSQAMLVPLPPPVCRRTAPPPAASRTHVSARTASACQRLVRAALFACRSGAARAGRSRSRTHGPLDRTDCALRCLPGSDLHRACVAESSARGTGAHTPFPVCALSTLAHVRQSVRGG